MFCYENFPKYGIGKLGGHKVKWGKVLSKTRYSPVLEWEVTDVEPDWNAGTGSLRISSEPGEEPTRARDPS